MNNGMKVDQTSSAHCDALPFEPGSAQQIFTADIRIMQQDGYARR